MRTSARMHEAKACRENRGEIGALYFIYYRANLDQLI
jgi:hypothetical protein